MEVPEGWKLVIVPIQHMFPNCQVRYKTKCVDMKSCDIPILELPDHLNIPKEFFTQMKPPEGFEGW